MVDGDASHRALWANLQGDWSVPDLGFSVQMDIPGWNCYGNVMAMCRYVRDQGFTDILEAGAFCARVGSAITANIPATRVKTVDKFYGCQFKSLRYRNGGKGGMTCADRFADHFHTLGSVQAMHAADDRLTVTEGDFFDYHQQHECVLLSIFPDDPHITYHDIFEHGLRLATRSLVIVLDDMGFKHGRHGADVISEDYDHEIVHPWPYQITRLMARRR